MDWPGEICVMSEATPGLLANVGEDDWPTPVPHTGWTTRSAIGQVADGFIEVGSLPRRAPRARARR